MCLGGALPGQRCAEQGSQEGHSARGARWRMAARLRRRTVPIIAADRSLLRLTSCPPRATFGPAWACRRSAAPRRPAFSPAMAQACAPYCLVDLSPTQVLPRAQPWPPQDLPQAFLTLRKVLFALTFGQLGPYTATSSQQRVGLPQDSIRPAGGPFRACPRLVSGLPWVCFNLVASLCLTHCLPVGRTPNQPFSLVTSESEFR